MQYKNNIIINLNDKNFQQEINKNNLVLVDFWAEWCNPCKIFSKVLEEVSLEYKNIVFAKLNIENYKTITEKYNIRSVPTILLFNNGNIIDKIIGSITKIQLKNFLNKNLK
ncbi:thioredoxin [Enterobacteriaceae endosymbiont of Donacia cincticornis]|uniref:thioredoxin n=1 Tax=Enterobacteriaceae endosymbiont of Donacia cincticornis TaxID=2675773 RepID=UPI001449C972|nr:thioredoxin [Enterobacteriaceae endosymbiont of Donacia cincticornis]QJC36124.1 thioredoxin [Enterobacteriaceae endosymbiont of Donacia cincticornis]